VFATLLSPLPRPDDDAPLADQIRTAVEAQEAAGLEPITDGRLSDPGFERLTAWLLAAGHGDAAGAPAVVEAWRHAASLTKRAVKQALPGPYSIGRRAGLDRSATLEVAGALGALVAELAGAGCPLVEIEETEAHHIGPDEGERALFAEAHRRLAEGITGTHVSLSIVGGSAWDAGLETIVDAPYASLAVDLIGGPDNWNLVTRLPGDRGVIAGVLPARDSPADAREMLLWAARHAAASRGRGLARVGLGSAGSWANLTWEAAVAKMTRLGDAAALAATPGGEGLARELDPRAVNARTAAMGHSAPRRERRTVR
jgi:methionine synthase II (cobalamin-independent)